MALLVLTVAGAVLTLAAGVAVMVAFDRRLGGLPETGLAMLIDHIAARRSTHAQRRAGLQPAEEH